MLTHFYRLVWVLLNFLATAYETLHWLCLRLQAAMLWSYDHWRSRTLIAHRDRGFFERCKIELSKLPRHLSIIIGPDDGQVDEEVLFRIFRYALCMDIGCVSVYDTRMKDCVRLEKLRPPKGVNWKQLQAHHFLCSLPNAAAAVNGKPTSNGLANGNANGHLHHQQLDKSLEIYEITAHDGRPLIADVCRELFAQRQSADVQALLKDRTRLTQYIGDELSQRLGKFTDPELCIIFNRHMCTYGMLPWQTRFTEFHTHETGRYFNAEAFANVLYKYSRCEQRWGK